MSEILCMQPEIKTLVTEVDQNSSAPEEVISLY